LKINYLNKPAVRTACQPLIPEVNNVFEIHYGTEGRKSGVFFIWFISIIYCKP